MSTFHELDHAFGLTRMAACAALVPIGVVVPSKRRASTLAVAAVFLALCLDGDTLPGLVITGTVTYLAARGLGRIHDAGVRWRIALGLIFVVVALFFTGRAARLDAMRAALGPFRLGWFALDMWLVLRVVTLFWEVGSGKIGLPRPTVFVGWIGLPFTMVGPLLRASDYTASLEHDAPRRLDASWAQRVAVACAMVLVAVALHLHAIPHDRQPRWMRAAMLFVTPWSFYLWAGGFFSLMSATSMAWGLTIPESFEKPFVRPNLAEFWAHWNATATAVFRDYVFYARWGRRARPNAYVNTFIVFALVGAWHDLGPFYLLWGVYHGLGYMAFLWFRAHKASLGWLRPKVPCRVLTWASIATTYGFVCFSWTLPLFAIEAVGRVAHRIHH
jgi:hypothetical protein